MRGGEVTRVFSGIVEVQGLAVEESEVGVVKESGSDSGVTIGEEVAHVIEVASGGSGGSRVLVLVGIEAELGSEGTARLGGAPGSSEFSDLARGTELCVGEGVSQNEVSCMACTSEGALFDKLTYSS